MFFTEVGVALNRLDDHAPYAGEAAVQDARRLARNLSGARVLHISSTPYGGGVAELLHTIVPLMRDAGLDARWYVIDGAPGRFFEVTKKIHNALQGMEDGLTSEEWALYEEVNRSLVAGFPGGPWDFVVIHDPQPLQMGALVRDSISSGVDEGGAQSAKWFWRCHIDMSTPLASTWERLHPWVNRYDGAIVTSRDYAGEEISVPVAEITPSIDPTSPKNLLVDPGRAREVLSAFSVDPDRPLLVQVSRFDPWKDPFGVIDAYRIVKAEYPDVQLALVGSIALDDPEGVRLLDDLKGAAGGDPDVRVLSNQDGVHAAEVAAFQQKADVVIQKSVREGFGLTITEGMWKARPVVAGQATGCRLQIEDGRNGYLIASTEECAARIVQILSRPDVGESLGREARETVRRRFLSTTHLARYLSLFAQGPMREPKV
jgi:trehalose synthase